MLAPHVTTALIGRIYEAGAFPERWPEALDAIARALGAAGGNLIRTTAEGLRIQSSPAIAEATRAFEDEGWNADNSRVARLLARADHGGFLTDSDLHSAEELATLPIYADFLNPRGAAAGAATIVQGARDDVLVVAIEAFRDHPASRAAAPVLDGLRPHIARAALLSSEIEAARVQSLVEAFSSVGAAIGLLDPRGRLLAASERFQDHLGGVLCDGPARLRMRDEESDRRLAAALAQLDRHATGLSVAARDRDKAGVAVLHLLPARHDARELFGRVATFALIARPGNGLLPSPDIIAALFDLTPAEARVARGIARGIAPADLARQLDVSPETIRSQLKRVYAKTSTRRQSELSLLLARLA
ncbi:helix-turn-helix transcriptional regulator [Sphingomonas parva]|uniref:Helix-turn-helix transcriptional regulator n=1 Tax=Sphingomonas parva TaxID=2555898 RepID=A0A4Y8ZMC8_9SPHN|nr:helix-turn-helix transcriptional regulator [Sphingomonas parva]TFI56412.1 helix-turn-helix transcriptional regulator [Sphingomonas parva]